MYPLACGIRANYWSIFAICEHIGAQHTAYVGRGELICGDKSAGIGVVVARLEVI